MTQMSAAFILMIILLLLYSLHIAPIVTFVANLSPKFHSWFIITQ